ncbi:UMP kinase [Candidatus Curtissbacteria bacterium RIFCSPHIGHO2_01_FULL_41_44]|uniref:Uridylate kinase n=1 Tax=Candidatus Curtissbacteria bacterium RIFCSPLOWO2_01_FULL_42_50 TaxID=1797730 RepID=A0A1F5H7L6_9BACT|nr:MAG: UMP kinase [Candidatus Curtissbacteria bacterium RIFCSPHIGHO2_01_FULL_41_44]OGD94287.1 MAG: UMP kinase [Candidatus Curtissbacteria bacterium RIFCSPHIGHO2_02_FULL_42_58]OGD97761.1 MAG: UMP kinase [Candidatus Curtissbacteria bacterium RIFCSPHIGHO2_12_FULL_42_33]OGE00153.1 MAG: UMP kinase [Candidatus Curtissbacteria bacterium RIFCSPLOWO2_01_FULL_42_50]OGE02079.1 MAG: UMP kinase [Candidatus Curtissbacteria bacterium RIFCSPLOWO2_12_FULL_41_16]OGE09758.1 MAG: UMP kinase [Candidatus Curtissba
MPQPKYKRVLLKLSGETFLGKREYGIDPEFCEWLAREIIKAHKTDAQIAVVVGGGNIFRGTSAQENGLERTIGDYIGMLATIMNSLALQAALEKENQETRVLSAIQIPDVCEPYIRRRAIRHMEKGRVVIFAGGTGNPYFTTDTAAALRALETECQIILKATKVDGVYNKDPRKYKDAKKLGSLTFTQAIADKEIEIMDNSALSLCMDHKIPILVFDLAKEDNIARAILGEKLGTLIF